MTAFGFSHIVSEVKNLELSENYLRKNNYEIEYKLYQEVNELKHSVLNKNPSHVNLVYLRNKKFPYIGIELIKHSKSSFPLKNKLILAHTGCKEKCHFSFDGNNVFFSKIHQGDINQHIIIPVSNINESEKYYKNNFGLKRYFFNFESLYKEININSEKHMALHIPGTIFKTWQAVIHLIEINNNFEKIFLNNIGFSCFCFLIKKNDIRKISNKNKIIGPFKSSKIVKGHRKEFNYAFMKDPDGYINELYII